MCNCQCPNKPVYQNPNQMEFPGFETRFPEKYQDGFRTGITWDANWMPGGPFIYKDRNGKPLEESQTRHRNWMEGFNNGLALRLKINPHFAAWWERNKGKKYYSSGVTIDEIRYTEPEDTCEIRRVA